MSSADTFLALAATGCISNSPGIPNLYVLSLKPKGVQELMEIRIGFFGKSEDSSCLPPRSNAKGRGQGHVNKLLVVLRAAPRAQYSNPMSNGQPS
jgi:hypothetical protein